MLRISRGCEVLAWRNARCFSERITEMRLITEVQLVGDLADRSPVFLDQLLRTIDLQLQNKLIRTFTNSLLEQPAEMVRAQVNQSRHFVKTNVELHIRMRKINYLL